MERHVLVPNADASVSGARGTIILGVEWEADSEHKCFVVTTDLI